VQRGRRTPHFNDASYVAVGATIPTPRQVKSTCASILQRFPKSPYSPKDRRTLVPLAAPRSRRREALNDRRVTILSFDLLPRISRASTWTPFRHRPRCRISRRLEGRNTLRPVFPTSHYRRGHDSTSQVLSWAWASPVFKRSRRRSDSAQGARLRRALRAKEEANRPARSS